MSNYLPNKPCKKHRISAFASDISVYSTIRCSCKFYKNSRKKRRHKKKRRRRRSKRKHHRFKRSHTLSCGCIHCNTNNLLNVFKHLWEDEVKSCSEGDEVFSEGESMNDKDPGTQQRPQKRIPADCPLDRDQLGNKTWSFLHTMVAYYPDRPTIEQQRDMSDFFTLFSKFYPCESCAEHFRNQLRASPPVVQNQEALTQWLCWVHNNVNRRIGKPQFDCRRVNERWRDGWPDGSCDY